MNRKTGLRLGEFGTSQTHPLIALSKTPWQPAVHRWGSGSTAWSSGLRGLNSDHIRLVAQQLLSRWLLR